MKKIVDFILDINIIVGLIFIGAKLLDFIVTTAMSNKVVIIAGLILMIYIILKMASESK